MRPFSSGVSPVRGNLEKTDAFGIQKMEIERNIREKKLKKSIALILCIVMLLSCTVMTACGGG